MSKLSASKSALILSPCLRWADGGSREYEDAKADTTKRDKGIEFHNAMDCYYGLAGQHLAGRGAISLKWSDVGTWYDLAAQWSKDHLEPRCEQIASEVYVAYNFVTGDVHADPAVRDRKYPTLPGFVPGTADLVCILSDGKLYVADWKTGAGTGADKQLLTLACGLRKAYPKPDGTLRDIVLAVLYAGAEGVHAVEWFPTQLELDNHAQAMTYQLQDVGVRNDAVPGIHCSQLYCPHLAYCPGVMGIVEELAEGEQALLPATSLLKNCSMTDNPISDEEAGYVMARITAAKRQSKYFEEAIRMYVTSGGRAIAGDMEFKQTNSGFRWVTRSQGVKK